MTSEISKINPMDIAIEKLKEKHDLNDFKSYEPELVSFLIEDALDNQRQNLSVTFLWFYKNRITGYITLLTDKINLEGNLKEFFREKDIHYKSLPALKIGRLCVHDDFLRRGIGKLMVLFAIKAANDINESKAGCRFITLDAKRNSRKELDSIHFYKRLGFKVLKERSKGATPMYLDLRTSNDN
ncbi:GNAT family N-acetyltransferase [Candidatus Woesearchaeota archaeon]|nr:GNAT family N-acetyltransferase [Candidatus Woesearchaeota archaeon]